MTESLVRITGVHCQVLLVFDYRNGLISGVQCQGFLAFELQEWVGHCDLLQSTPTQAATTLMFWSPTILVHCQETQQQMGLIAMTNLFNNRPLGRVGHPRQASHRNGSDDVNPQPFSFFLLFSLTIKMLTLQECVGMSSCAWLFYSFHSILFLEPVCYLIQESQGSHGSQPSLAVYFS